MIEEVLGLKASVIVLIAVFRLLIAIDECDCEFFYDIV